MCLYRQLGLGKGGDPRPGIPDDHCVEHEAHNDQEFVVEAGVGQAKEIEDKSASGRGLFHLRRKITDE